jgi:hypothetical protein
MYSTDDRNNVYNWSSSSSSSNSNNRSPHFDPVSYEFSVIEGQWNERVGQVHAFDLDSNSLLTMSIEPDEYRDYFFIANGVCYLLTYNQLFI